MRSYYFYFIVLGFFSGVFATFNLPLSVTFLLTLAIVFLSVIGFLILYAKVRERPFAHPILLIALFVLSGSLGALRMEECESSSGASELQSYIGSSVTMVGIVDSDVGVDDTTAVIKVYALRGLGEVVKITGERVLLRSPFASFDYGDKVKIEGVLLLPENFSGSGGKVFDYVSYLRKDGIKFMLEYPRSVVLDHARVTPMSILHSIKRWFISNVERLVPEPASALATGVTIAGKGGLPKDVTKDFIDAGLIHIVVLSGYNIAIVVGALSFFTRRAGRKWSALLSLCGILAFVMMAGGSPPVVRASIMASIMVLGTLSYTKILQNRALFAAALIMVLWNPFTLTSDASFALSFLATFAIVNIVPVTTHYLSFITPRFKLRQVLSETLSVQIFVLPYLLYEIGRVSVVAPLSNIIVLPFIPAIMILCFIVGLIGWIPMLVLPIAGVLYILCAAVISIAHAFSLIPFAALDMTISLWTMVFLYTSFLGYYLVASSKRAPATS